MTRYVFIAIAFVGACDRPGALGRVSVALSEDLCADFCLDALRASLYREGEEDLPLGPALQSGCGEELTFSALPAGERVVVILQGFDITGEVWLDGRSEGITVIADGVAEARVPMSPSARPELLGLEPEPVVAGAEVILSGVFGAPLGEAEVVIGANAYGSDAWAWTLGAERDDIALTLPLDALGGDVVVRRCGVASEALELRVIGAKAGEAAVTGACGEARAAVVRDGTVWIAWSCDGDGELASMRLDDALCPLDPGASWPLGVSPTALAVRDEVAWIGSAGGLLRLDLGAGGVTTLSSEPVSALAATAHATYAILGGRLVAADGPRDIAGVDPGLTALAASAETLYAAGVSADGGGRLLIVPASEVVSAHSLAHGDEECRRPLALAVSGATVALACEAGGVALWRDDALRFVSGEPFSALAFDERGDVLFASAGGALTLIDAEAGRILHRFEASTAPPALESTAPALLIGLPGHRLLMPTATSPLAVVTPFDRRGPCP